jgi:hypothetical protein
MTAAYIATVQNEGATLGIESGDAVTRPSGVFAIDRGSALQAFGRVGL